MNNKSQMGILGEVFLLILILSIFVLFWNYYSQNTFLVGLLNVQEGEAKHTCSGLLFPLVSDEYIKSGDDNELAPIEYFKEFLEMSEVKPYPSPERLLEKARNFYKGAGLRVNIRVYNGTEWVEVSASEAEFYQLLGSELPTGTCSLPIYSLVPEYAGKVDMSVRI
ncbi:hypothetical protein GF352_04840 [archaeon]|nr:hypothetical protein [archaeon]